MAQGTVKWFKAVKGFGFITPKDGSSDVFVHHTAIVSDEKYKTLADNAVVEFDVEKTDKGLRAANVRVIVKSA